MIQVVRELDEVDRSGKLVGRGKPEECLEDQSEIDDVCHEPGNDKRSAPSLNLFYTHV